MNFRSSPGQRSRVETTLELTPLIDVIFLLLIFFVMTTTPAMSAVERLDLDLPGADSGAAVETDETDRFAVQVHVDGTILVREGDGAEPREVEDLHAEMVRWHRESPNAAVWIQGDVEASHGAVIELLDTARTVGFERIHMAVRPQGQ